jgi:ABC-type cobalamin transport system permease subunit
MNKVAQISDLQGLFGSVVGVLVALAGVVLFVFIVIAGLKFLTSGGDPKAVEEAKKTLTYAVGGLVAILLSYLALLLIERIAGLNTGTLTNFKVTL